jgi:serine/threonine-protein phosphatase 6 regulatory ankyrin repeat subunit B
MQAAPRPKPGLLPKNVLVAIEADRAGALVGWNNHKLTHLEDTEPGKRQTALIFACRHGATACLQFLINAGADVNAQMKAGASAAYVAVQQSQEVILKMLVQEGADLNLPRDNGGTPLILAAQRINKPMLLHLLEAGVDINVASPRLGSPLFVAVEAVIRSKVSSDGDPTQWTSALECLSVILGAGAHVDSINQSLGVTALFLAAQASDKHCVKLLISAGANCNLTRHTKSYTGGTALHNAAWRGNATCMKLLIDGGANVNARKRNGNSALHSAAQIGDLGCLQMLLEHGANVHSTKNTGETALMLAANEGHLECVKALIAAGANVHVTQQSAEDGATDAAVAVTALFLAAKNRHIQCAEWLLLEGAVPTFSPRLISYLQENISERTRKETGVDLHKAAAEVAAAAPVDSVEPTTCASAASTTDATDGTITAATTATTATTAATATAATAASAAGGTEKTMTTKKKCMIRATWQQKLGVLRELVKHGANVNTRHDEKVGVLQMQQVVLGAAATAVVSVEMVTVAADGSTPLVLTAKTGWEAGMHFFVSNGANLNAENNTGHTALHITIADNRTELVALLLASGAMAEVRKLTLETPLALSIEKGHGACVALLVKAGVVVNPPVISTAPLFSAVRLNRLECVKYLLDAGAHVNSARNDGVTPIIAAAEHGHAECLKMLLSQDKADVDAARRDGSSAIGVAVIHHHHAAIQVLIDAFCDVNSARQDGMTPLLQVVQQKESTNRDTTIDMLLAAGESCPYIPHEPTPQSLHACS